MALTATVLADHKGMTTPRVSGDEYYVDAKVVMTTYANTDVVTAASLGLNTINAVTITGNSQSALYEAQVECSDAGAYASGSSFTIILLDNSNANDAELANGSMTATTILVRVWGNL